MKKYKIITEKDIIELLNKEGNLTRTTIAEKLNTSLYQVRNILECSEDIILIPFKHKNLTIVRYSLKTKIK